MASGDGGMGGKGCEPVDGAACAGKSVGMRDASAGGEGDATKVGFVMLLMKEQTGRGL